MLTTETDNGQRNAPSHFRQKSPKSTETGDCKIGSGDNNHTITLDMGVNVKHGLWQELELALL